MSKHLVALVYTKVVGSMARKAVLAYCADRAGDNGRGVWCSKQRIAAEIEASRKTVISVMRQMVQEGLLVEVGRRRALHGYTVEYDINVAALKALPDTKHVLDETPEDVQNYTPPADQGVKNYTPKCADLHASKTAPVQNCTPKCEVGLRRSVTSLHTNRPETVLKQDLPPPPPIGPTPLRERDPAPAAGGGGQAAPADPPQHDPDSPEIEALTDRVIAAAGVDLSKDVTGRWAGSAPRMTVAMWCGMGLTARQIVEEIARAKPRNGPPGSLAYWTPAMRRLSGLAKTVAATAPPERKPVSDADILANVRNRARYGDPEAQAWLRERGIDAPAVVAGVGQ